MINSMSVEWTTQRISRPAPIADAGVDAGASLATTGSEPGTLIRSRGVLPLGLCHLITLHLHSISVDQLPVT